MRQIIDTQRKFFRTDTTKDVKFRIEQLKKLRNIIKENENKLYEAIYKDFKKSKFDTIVTELTLLYSDIKEVCKNLKKWSKRKKVRNNAINFPGKSYIIAEPLGICLIIGAWNYPFQLSLAPLIAALSAGNTAILKPSELAPNSSRIIAEIINNNFPEEYIKVIEGGVKETTELLKYKFDKIFFTGSSKVGKIVYEAAARNLTPVTLELGGKSPAFVLSDCDIKISAKRLVWGKFLNAGQTCIAPDYILVHSSIKEKLLKQLKEEIIKSHLSVENNNYVQIINDRNMKRCLALMDTAKIYHGGNYDIEARIIEPTIMSDIDFEHKIMQEEIFAPILPVLEFSDLNIAIEEVTKRAKPLSCYIFTNNKNLKNKILESISFGGGAVNDTIAHITNSKLPFGGVGDSGIGSYHGKYGFDTFSHYKGIVERKSWYESELKYYPHTENKLKWIKKLIN